MIRRFVPILVVVGILVYLHMLWFSPAMRATRTPIPSVGLVDSKFGYHEYAIITNSTMRCVEQPKNSLAIDCSLPINGQTLRIETQFRDHFRHDYRGCTAHYASLTFGCTYGWGRYAYLQVAIQDLGIDEATARSFENRPFWERISDQTWMQAMRGLAILLNIWFAWYITWRWRKQWFWRTISALLIMWWMYIPFLLLNFLIFGILQYFD